VSLAFVFPGQGSQQVGMGKALASAFQTSKAVFAEADEALGFPLSKLCFEGPEADLQLTANTQPAILATSIAALHPLLARGVKPDWVAGHSLGEYSALVAAGSLSLSDALRTVRRRGQYMQEAVPVGTGAMAAILGLDLPLIDAACREAAQGQVVSPANVNSPGQVVIAGHKQAVERAAERCKAKGAKRAIPLPVSAPFHCALMQPAQDRLAPILASIRFADPKPPLVNNVDADVVRDGNACRAGLVRQVSGTVRWQDSVERLVEEGVTTFVEVGPGTVLSGLVRKIAKGARVLSVDSPESLEATAAALAGGAEG
jgi:[acyl-carrier-protein] S-malonyltransferase